MNYIKNYGFAAAASAIILLLVIMRLTGNNFRPDALKRAVPSFDVSNIIHSSNEMPDGEILLIILGEGGSGDIDASEKITLEPNRIMDRENIRKIRRHDGPVVLYSSDQSISAKVWMVLAQTGIKDIYILSHEVQ